MNLTDFLLARIDEDEAVAFDLDADGYTVGALGGKLVTVIGGRQLRAECKAKRRIVWTHLDGIAADYWDRRTTTLVVQILAQPYASHPDFDPEWLL